MLCVILSSSAQATTITEHFASDPLNGSWRVFGDSSLFVYDPAAQNLKLTWDSGHSNSFFYIPLGTILTKDDSFSFSLDLKLSDVHAGVNTNKPSTFELSFGFLNLNNATKTNFFRSNSAYTANLVEFDFFADTGFGPTIWPSVWSTNSQLNYNGPDDYTVLSLPTGVVMNVTMDYSAANQTLTTSVLTNDAPLGTIHSVTLTAAFSDFRVNAFAIESYNDSGQDPRYGGSLLAHGIADNIVLILPPPAVENLSLNFSNQIWRISFSSKTNWLYSLERSLDLQQWLASSEAVPGTGGMVFLQDTNAPGPKVFYRVRAEHP